VARALTSVAAILAAVAMIGLSADKASAESDHSRVDFFHFPGQAADATSLPERTIALRGRYRWVAFTRGVRRPRVVKLHGRYVWRDWVVVRGKGYRHYTTLTNAATGGRVTNYNDLPNQGSDAYWWGSTIENVLAH
jgi:hypothetical protein